MKLYFNIGLNMILHRFRTIHDDEGPFVKNLEILGQYIWEFLDDSHYRIDPLMTLTKHSESYSRDSKKIG